MAQRDIGGVFSFRSADGGDIEAIVQFNQLLAEETEGRTLDPRTLHEGVHRGMQQCPEVRYFVAEFDGRVIGQVMLTREWSDWRNGWMLWLQSVYVHRKFRRQGVFRGLLRHALSVVNPDGQAKGLRLYVEQQNEAAIATYEKLTFGDAGYRILEIVPLTGM